MHVAIKELEDEADSPISALSRSDERKKHELKEILNNCRNSLAQLEGLLTKFKSLGTQRKRKWDKIRLSAEGLDDARSKVSFHTSAINLFVTTLGTSSLGRIETKLDQLAQDIRQGLREGGPLLTEDG